MARPLRIEFPDAIYHITSRGNAQENIYLDDSDRLLFIETLAQTIKRFDWVCHAYCLMGNHYHLLIQTPKANLSKGMRHLNGVYTQRFNRKHQRMGHVFQGRYKAILIERDAHLLELCRYIVRNPVAAHMVEQAEDWPWSSYHTTQGIEGAPEWLSIEWVLSQFASTKVVAQKQYKQFVADGAGQKPVWDKLSQQIYLGHDDFIDDIKSKLDVTNIPAEVPQEQWKASRKPLQDYNDKLTNRHEAMTLAYLEGEYKMNEIAKCFGVHYTTVSRAVKKHE